MLLLLIAGLSYPQKVRAAEKQAARVQTQAAAIHGLVDHADEVGRPIALDPLRSHVTELQDAMRRLEATVAQLEAGAAPVPD